MMFGYKLVKEKEYLDLKKNRPVIFVTTPKKLRGYKATVIIVDDLSKINDKAIKEIHSKLTK